MPWTEKDYTEFARLQERGFTVSIHSDRAVTICAPEPEPIEPPDQHCAPRWKRADWSPGWLNIYVPTSIWDILHMARSSVRQSHAD
jgi:hypothetical protein